MKRMIKRSFNFVKKVLTSDLFWSFYCFVVGAGWLVEANADDPSLVDLIGIAAMFFLSGLGLAAWWLFRLINELSEGYQEVVEDYIKTVTSYKRMVDRRTRNAWNPWS